MKHMNHHTCDCFLKKKKSNHDNPSQVVKKRERYDRFIINTEHIKLHVYIIKHVLICKLKIELNNE